MFTMSQILVAITAFLHLIFMTLEMFFWTKPIGQKVFRMEKDFMLKSKALAANQGLYNAFLAAGLIWSLFHTNNQFQIQLQIFFLSCVVIAGVYGALTVSRRILYIQALPAVVALILVSLY